MYKYPTVNITTEKVDFPVNRHTAHCFIFAPDDAKYDNQPRKFSISMQMRFDGHLGFPGGLVDDGENNIETVIREVKEENNFELDMTQIKYVVSFYNETRKYFHHCYSVHLTLEELEQMERNVHYASKTEQHNLEVLGIIRVPLYTLADGYRGFPAFLRNNFAGSSKDQLLYTIKHLNLLTEDEIDRALNVNQVK